jgi:hypothetical protein
VLPGPLPKSQVPSPHAEQNKVDDPLVELMARAGLALGDSGRRVIQIATSEDSADGKMRKIVEIDAAAWGWKSPQWGQLLNVTDRAIRKTAFWREDRPRHFAAAASRWRDLHPDSELPDELRNWDEDNE